AAVGGQPIEVTVEGRNRFTINVRYPRELRQDIERLRHVLMPLRMGTGGSAAPAMGGSGAIPEASPVLLASAGVSDAGDAYFAQAMGGSPSRRPGGMGGAPGGTGGSRGGMEGTGQGNPLPPGGAPAAPGLERWGDAGGQHVPLGQVADIRIVTGPPMIRDEAGMLVGYVYVDMDASKRDIGGYVDDAKRAVAREMKLPPGYSLEWTGQYELLRQMQARMKIL